jgi:hypothetical protein
MTYLVTKWYNFIFAAIFIVYGSVKIILSILDRNYETVTTSVFFLLLGIILISIWLAYREYKMWGWWGLIGMNAVVIVLALWNITMIGNIILLFLSLVTILLMLAPTTKAYVLSRH